MQALTCVSVVVCVVRKLRPCLSYSRRRDCINLGLFRSLDKAGGDTHPHRHRHMWHGHKIAPSLSIPYERAVSLCKVRGPNSDAL